MTSCFASWHHKTQGIPKPHLGFEWETILQGRKVKLKNVYIHMYKFWGWDRNLRILFFVVGLVKNRNPSLLHWLDSRKTGEGPLTLPLPTQHLIQYYCMFSGEPSSSILWGLLEVFPRSGWQQWDQGETAAATAQQAPPCTESQSKVAWHQEQQIVCLTSSETGQHNSQNRVQDRGCSGPGSRKKNKILKPDLCHSPEFSLYRKKFLFLKTAQQQDKSNQEDIF